MLTFLYYLGCIAIGVISGTTLAKHSFWKIIIVNVLAVGVWFLFFKQFTGWSG